MCTVTLPVQIIHVMFFQQAPHSNYLHVFTLFKPDLNVSELTLNTKLKSLIYLLSVGVN